MDSSGFARRQRRTAAGRSIARIKRENAFEGRERRGEEKNDSQNNIERDLPLRACAFGGSHKGAAITASRHDSSGRTGRGFSSAPFLRTHGVARFRGDARGEKGGRKRVG